MKTLFSRILIAQVVAVVLALAVVTVITRLSLARGFDTFLQQQETTMLQVIAPALTEFYESRGSWELIRDNPNNWQRVWRINRAGDFAGRQPPGGPRQGPGPGRGRGAEAEPPGGPVPIQAPGERLDPELRWLARSGRGMLRDRLFLLDRDKQPIAGPEVDSAEAHVLEAILVGGEAVGWIGFAPLESALPPEAQRFLEGQVMIMLLALVPALVFAAILAWILAGNVSRPVKRVGQVLRRLSDGDYEARATGVAAGEMGVLATHVNQLAESLEKSRTARQRWMADIAHELRTPVAVMKGEIEAIVDGVRSADGRTAASLNEEINHLASMVDDLQALALADAGALSIRKELVDLTELAEQSAESFRNRLEERNIGLETELEDRFVLSGDAQRLRQLLHNLLENSSRYTEDGGRVRLSLGIADEISLVLEDSGPGVSDEQLARLFDRFYRAEGSRSRLTGGSGLGLSICRNIAEAHGGTIEAGHSPLGGLLIRVTLPA